MISAQKFNEYAQSPGAFRADLMVDVSGVVKRFGEVQDDWQRTDFAAIDAGLMVCNGRATADVGGKMRAYLERARGHSKTTDLAILVVWALAFATRPLKGYAFAADRDQAVLLKNAVDVLIRLNPWLGELIEVQKNLVVNKAEGHPGYGASLEISSSDVASSYGILPDLIIADELTHWEGDGSLFQSLLSSAGKRTSCLFVIISNAGFAESWQWGVREAIREDEDWYFSRLDGPVASWMSEKSLAEQRRILPGLSYNRLWLNEWSSAGGDALTKEDINAAFRPELSPMSGGDPAWKFVGGLDRGLTRDCSAVVVLAVPADGRAGKIRLAHHKLWRPTLGKKIDLLEVERYILSLDEEFNLEFVAFDPWQAEHLAATLDADSGRRRRNQRRVNWAEPWMREIPPVAVNLRAQATLTIEFFTDHRIQLFDCEPLRRDLHKLRVEEKSYGPRLVSPRTGEGHGDSFSAFALALLMAHELSGKRVTILGDLLGGSTSGAASWEAAWERRLAEHAEEQELDRLDAQTMRSDRYGLQDAIRSGQIHQQITVTQVPRNWHWQPTNHR